MLSVKYVKIIIVIKWMWEARVREESRIPLVNEPIKLRGVVVTLKEELLEGVEQVQY